MKKDGRDYFNAILDLTTAQKIKTIKSMCGNIIKNLSLKFDGYANFIVNYCLLHINYIINNDKKEEIDYSLLNEYKSDLFNNFTQDSILEISIIILVINSPYVKLKSLELMKYIFKPNFQKLLMVKDELLIDRNCLLLGFFIDKLFDYETENPQFRLGIEYLFKCLFFYETNKAVSYEAANAIKDLLYFKDYQETFDIIFEEIMPQIVLSIKDNDNIIFFEILFDIILFFDKTKYYIEILKQVTIRILKEFKTNHRIKDKEDNKYNVYINKCFNIIKKLTGFADFCSHNEVIHYFNIIFIKFKLLCYSLH